MDVTSYCKSLTLSLLLGIAIPLAAQNRCIVTYHNSYTGSCGQAYVADDVDVRPQFPGGENALIHFINHERRYPRAEYHAGIEGRVMCSFIVTAEGKVSNVEVIRGVTENLDREAVRIIREMPHWEAGRVNGARVPVYCLLTIPFRR